MALRPNFYGLHLSILRVRWLFSTDNRWWRRWRYDDVLCTFAEETRGRVFANRVVGLRQFVSVCLLVDFVK